MMHDLYKRVKARQTLIGTWLFLNDVGVAEIVAKAGYDFVVIDMEHSPTGFDNLRNLMMATEHYCPPIVRVKANTPEFISAILDLGPAGIMVPRVRTAEEAAFAVQNAKYYPLGLRGFGPYRVSHYSRDTDLVLAEANERQMLWIQIEHKDALTNLKEIVKVPGIDAFFIGMGDLSHSLGHLGDANHPEVIKKVRYALKIIRETELPAGSAFGNSKGLDKWHKAGMNIFTVAADFRFVLNGANEALASTKQILGLKD